MGNDCLRALRHALLATITLLATGLASAETASPVDRIPITTARAVVQRAIELVETQALYPRSQKDYAAAKARLLMALDGAGDEVERQQVLAPITALLNTLDADGHAFIMAPRWQRHHQQTLSTARAQPQASSFALVPTAHGPVLHWTPPQSLGELKTEAPRFLARFNDDYAATSGADKACALVIDLSAQVGGNAWPPLFAMHPLFTDGNLARWVDRDGARTALVQRPGLRETYAFHGGASPNPLGRFDGTPFAVVSGKTTSSAGEMLLVALMGEGARVRTFGHTTHGLSNANASHTLADGSLLGLTTKRYAIGDGAPIRGGIAPQVSAESSATIDDAVMQAAEWAAQASPLCGSIAPTPVNAAAHPRHNRAPSGASSP